MENFNAPYKPFRFWCQKVLPLVYDDSLSYYELLCKVVDYINKNLEDINSLAEGFTELKSFVENYFDNLDVNEIIDQKLDLMALDGTLTNLISGYITPYIQSQDAYNRDTRNLVIQITDEQTNRINTIQGMVGSPLVAVTASQMTDHNRIYVYTGSETGYVAGNWYYWDGEAWVSGGVYNAVAVNTDKTFTQHDVPADALAVGMFKSGVDNGLNSQIFRSADVIDNTYWYKTGNDTIGNLAANHLKRYKKIPLIAGKTYTLLHFYAEFSFIGDVDGNYISDFKSNMLQMPDEKFNNDCSLSFIAPVNAYLYATIHKNNQSGHEQLLDGSYIPPEYVEGYYPKYLYGVDIPVIQFVNQTKNLTDNSFWIKNSEDNIGYYASNDTARVNPILLKKGITYTFTNCYAQFTFIANLSGVIIRDFAITNNETLNYNYTGTYTPTEDCLLCVTRDKRNATAPTRVYSGNVLKYTSAIPQETGWTGLFDRSDALLHETTTIHVAKDGSGNYTKIADAVNYANALPGSGTVDIIIHEGTYDILSELGGSAFITLVEATTGERQGLGIWRDNVNLIGVGRVILQLELPDTVSYNASSKISTLNLGQYNANLENLIIVGKNCRYAVHDECNLSTRYTKRKVKNVRCIHKGNVTGLWQYPIVWGGGAGGGCEYDFIDCQFITHNYSQAWSYHVSANLSPCKFNLNGCLGICTNGGKSFRLGYMGDSAVGVNVATLKNCFGNGSITVENEREYDTVNNIELYSTPIIAVSPDELIADY